MADNEFIRDAELKKLFQKHGIDEDPIIVLSRFLNIFKQLHIFSAEQAEDFNKMILAFPPELRGYFKMLAGGQLLQEYVDELESKTGNVRQRDEAACGPTAPSTPGTEGAAEAAATAPAMAIAGSGKVVADASFVQEMTKAFVLAMRHNEQSKKEEERIVMDDTIRAQSEILINVAKEQGRAMSKALIRAFRGRVRSARFDPYDDDELDDDEFDSDNDDGYSHSRHHRNAPKREAVHKASALDKLAEAIGLSAVPESPAPARTAAPRQPQPAAERPLPAAEPVQETVVAPVLTAPVYEPTPMPAPAPVPAAADEPSSASVPAASGEKWELQETAADSSAKAASGWEDSFVAPTPTVSAARQPAVDEEAIDSGDEWEWDYEEVDTDGNPVQEAKDEASGDEEWEWDYEEVPEGGASPSADGGAAATTATA